MTRGHLGPHRTAACGDHHDVAEEYWYGRADITQDGINNPQSLGQVRFVAWKYNESTCTLEQVVEASGGWTAILKNCPSNVITCPLC